MEYLAWNDAIGAHFFNADKCGTRVFLYVTKAVVNEIGTPHDADLDDFLAAVNTGPSWNSRQGWSICQQALQALDAWRNRDLEYPPYLAYLALFALADTVKVEGFSRASYYPGLRLLLGEEPAAGGYASFDKMYELWFDLEVWSNEDKNGELGIFHADILGNREYVGLPKAQTILTDDERHKLPLLFAENGFDPSSPPSDRELSHLLAREMHHYLLPRTKHLLDDRGSEEPAAREVLLDAILDELEDWDGTVPPQAELGEKARSSLGNLRLAMALDRTAKTVRFSLRCRSTREYPEEDLRLICENDTEVLYCCEDWQGWSTPLCEGSEMRLLDATRLDWRAGLTLVDTERAWRTVLSRRPVRVMVSALPFGFDGFVEESQIPQGKPFYLLAHKDHGETLQKWGRDCCTGFSEVEALSGMPHGWVLYSLERANTDTVLRDALPFLAFPTVLRIHLRGGLKVRGSQYFSFALPHIEVTGTTEPVELFCNDCPLERDAETGLFIIPDGLRARRLFVEVRRDGECIRSRSLYALETLEWLDVAATGLLDRFGRKIDGEADEACAGSIVDGAAPPEFNPEVFLPPSYGHRVYFIGCNPGEIVECPSETMPDDWRPVWAVVMKKKGKGNAVYCGADPSSEKPTRIPRTDYRHLRLWKEVLWHKRKRISTPSHPALCALWKEYKEVAHHVR